jgi:hypothetical protein
MGSGFGLSRAVSGAVEGMNQTEARRDRASNREYQDVQRERQTTQFDQGQEDREFALRRQDIETARNDEQYKVQKDAQDRQKAGGEALRAYMTTGDVKALEGFANQYTTEGITHEFTKNDDGTYTFSIDNNGKKESKIATADDMGSYAQYLLAKDPYAEMKGQQGLKREAAATKSERKHDMALLEKEYGLKRGVEHVKGKYKEGGKDGKVSDHSKVNIAWAKTKYGGQFANGAWSFDNDTDRKAEIAANLADTYYLTGSDATTAQREAGQAIAQMEAKATEVAKTELDEGGIDEKGYDARVIELMNAYTDAVIKSKAPKPGDMSGAEDQAGGQKVKDKPVGQPGSGIPSANEYIEDVVNDPPPESSGMTEDEFRNAAREDYQTRYGGEIAAAEEAAPSAPTLERPTAEGEKSAVKEDTSMSIPGISDANAGEAPNLKRQKQAEEDAATEEGRRKEQRSGVKPETLKRKKAERTGELKRKAEETRLGRGNKKARAEQERNLRRYRKLKSTARAKTMSEKQLGLALLAAESRKEKDDIKRILKAKGNNGDK